MITLYTVLSTSGEVEARSLSAADAAEIVLTHDGRAYEVQPETGECAGWYQLCRSSGSANGPGGLGKMRPTSVGYPPDTKLVRCFAAGNAEAWPILAEMVVTGCGAWRRCPKVMTDADYDAMMAELADDIAAQQEG